MAQQREVQSTVGVETAMPSVRWPSARAAYRRLYRWVALTDVVAVELALLGAYWVRFGIEVPTDDFLLLLAGAPILVLAIFAAAHLYQAFRLAPAEEFRRIVFAVSASIGVIMLDSFWLRADLSRAWVGTSWALGLLFALTARRLWHARFGHLRETGVLAFPTVIVGENEEATRLLSIMSSPASGFRPIGVVATSDLGSTSACPSSGRSTTWPTSSALRAQSACSWRPRPSTQRT